MPDTYFIDFEAFSPLDLTKVGAYRYAEHPEARIMLCAIARNDGPVELWDERDAFDSHAATGLIGDMLADPDALVVAPVFYTHRRAHETGRKLVCRLLLEKKKKK